MIAELPVFEDPKSYMELPALRGARYRYLTLRSVPLVLSRDTGIRRRFHDAKGRVWLTIDGPKATISKDYAWNGCSPKWTFMGMWCGTPDCSGNRLPSLFHDAFAQFISTEEFPFSKTEVDLIFLRMMSMLDFPLANMYYGAVKSFGKYKSANGEYSTSLSSYA